MMIRLEGLLYSWRGPTTIWRRVITTKLGRTRYKVDKARGASDKRSIWPSTMPGNLVKRWHEDSAVKWIAAYAAQLSPSDPDPHHGPSGVLEDLDAPGGVVYETVKQLMQTQNIQGDPQDFIPAYKKELETVTTMRLKEVSPAVAQYVRAKKLAVRLRMILTEKKDK